ARPRGTPAGPAVGAAPRGGRAGRHGIAPARGDVATGRLPLPAPWLPALRHGARWDDHPPHRRRPHVDPSPPGRRARREGGPPSLRRPRGPALAAPQPGPLRLVGGGLRRGPGAGPLVAF